MNKGGRTQIKRGKEIRFLFIYLFILIYILYVGLEER